MTSNENGNTNAHRLHQIHQTNHAAENNRLASPAANRISSPSPKDSTYTFKVQVPQQMQQHAQQHVQSQPQQHQMQQQALHIQRPKMEPVDNTKQFSLTLNESVSSKLKIDLANDLAHS